MKICVIGHTTTYNSIDDLPVRAKFALAEADLVLHVGNVGGLTFLNGLQDKYSLVFAVYGNLDSEETQRYLEKQKVVKFANRQIGMSFNIPGLGASLSLPGMKKPILTPDTISQQLLAMFSEVDCVVFGYPGRPFNYLYQGCLIFNPGQINPSTEEGGTLGILDITDRSITGRIISV